jgi:hypothetical protein
MLLGALWACTEGGGVDTAQGDSGLAPARRLGRQTLAEGATLRGEAAGDQAGAAVTGLADFDGDGIGDVAVGAPGAGVAYVLLGPVSGERSLADAEGRLSLGMDAGAAVGDVGDLDGDGRSDLGVGSPLARGTGTVLIFVGPEPQQAAGDAWLTLSGDGADSAFGARVGSAGDWDADGRDDLLVGAWLSDHPGEDAGAICVLVGLQAGERDGCEATDLRIAGDAAGDWLGYGARGGGDVDGDGHLDLVLGADGTDVPGSNAGSAWLVRGPLLGTYAVGEVALRFNGEAAADNAGHAVALVPDTDGDGRDDVAAGAFGNSATGKRAGAAYLLRNPVSAAPLAEGAVVVRGPATFDHFGYSLIGLGDADGDGLGDLLVGARFDAIGGADAGAAWLLYGPVDPTLDLDSTAAHLTGNAAEEAGYTLGSGADVDGDSLPDGVVGAPMADGEAGRAYVVTGVR